MPCNVSKLIRNTHLAILLGAATTTIYSANRPNGHDPGSAYLGNQYAVALSDAHRYTLAILAQGAGADGENLALVELLDAGLGQEDTAGGLGLGLDALDEDAVEQGDEGLDGSDRGSLYREEKPS